MFIRRFNGIVYIQYTLVIVNHNFYHCKTFNFAIDVFNAASCRYKQATRHWIHLTQCSIATFFPQ